VESVVLSAACVLQIHTCITVSVTRITAIDCGVSNLCKPMLTFENTKTNTPCLYFDSSAPHIWTVTISSVKQSKTNVTHLSRRNKLPHPIAGLPAPWVLSSAGKLIRYLHGSYFLLCLHWTQAAWHDKSPTVNCCHVLFMIYWHISNDFQGSLCRIQCRQKSGVDVV